MCVVCMCVLCMCVQHMFDYLWLKSPSVSAETELKFSKWTANAFHSWLVSPTLFFFFLFNWFFCLKLSSVEWGVWSFLILLCCDYVSLWSLMFLCIFHLSNIIYSYKFIIFNNYLVWFGLVETIIFYVAQTSLEFTLFLPQPLWCRRYMYIPLWPALQLLKPLENQHHFMLICFSCALRW